MNRSVGVGISVFEEAWGPEHPHVGTSLNTLAEVYISLERFAEAESLYKRSIIILEKTKGRESLDVGVVLNKLANLYMGQGRYAEAKPLYKRAVALDKKTFGSDHPETATTIANLASLRENQGKFSEAEVLHKRALAMRQKALEPDHPSIAASFYDLARLYFKQRNWPLSVDHFRHSTAVLERRTLRDTTEVGRVLRGKVKSEAERYAEQFKALIKAAYRLAPEGSYPDVRLTREMFRTAQWSVASEAAQSMMQMGARSAKGDPGLAALIRERQDLVAEWQKRDLQHYASIGEAPEIRKIKAQIEANNLARLAAIDARITAIDKRLVAEFPNYSALTSPAPLSVEEVQTHLEADEALVLFLDTNATFTPLPEETFIWVVTKTDVRWVRSKLGTVGLAREVQALRCGLDASAWHGPHCAKLLNADFTEADANAGKPLPFHHARAHALYKALFGQVEDVIKGKHLLIVPSGPLTQLPFQALVTAPPAGAEHKSAHWLVRDHAVTILPAVSSLKALRRTSQPSHAAKPMIGFGNPLLDGPQNDPQYGAFYKKRAKQARDNQQCRTSFQRVAAIFGWRGVTPVETRGGLAQVSHIRMQAPLPETADELCAVASDLKADTAEMRLGSRATEHEVKRLSASGQLAQYRVIHFATHGTLAGELKGTSEPGLLLTPPASASEDDDGYLSASEIAALKLDADWVILSACNTAAGNADGAEALSGLARAFIYAQARALLVSHWSVNSDATVKLITGAMREMASDPKVGRAEAMRRSMLALIDKGDAREAHPANWAPFIVVGEGAR